MNSNKEKEIRNENQKISQLINEIFKKTKNSN